MNVRELEKWIQRLNENVSRETLKKQKPKKDAVIREKESLLRQKFGTAVEIKQSNKKGRGKIEIEYYSTDDLNRVLELLER